MNRISKAAALVAAVVVGQWASGSIVPLQSTAQMTIDGSSVVEIPTRWDEKEKSFVLATEDGSWTYEGAEGQVTLTLTMNPDPFISYGIAVTDFGAPSTFGFAFGTPIVATGAPNLVRASVVGAMTDSTGDGVGITPFPVLGPLQTATVGLPSTSMGVDVGGPVSYPPGAAGSLYPYPSAAAGPIAGPGPGPWTFLSTTTAFTGSGGGDVFVLTGYAEIVVPEPAMLSLALLAAPLAMGRRFRRR